MTVTIDQIGLKSHQRYAQDQQLLDPTLLSDSSLVSPLSEINGTSTIYTSQWEQLFDLQIRNLPWAAFTTPPKYRLQGRRFFSHRILPTIYIQPVKQEEGEDQGEEEEKERKEHKNYLEAVLTKVKEKGSSSEHCLKESNTLVNLFELIGNLNEMLDQIQSRRLQYQKG